MVADRSSYSSSTLYQIIDLCEIELDIWTLKVVQKQFLEDVHLSDL